MQNFRKLLHLSLVYLFQDPLMQTAVLISKTFLNEQVIELKLKTKKTQTQPGQRFFVHYLDEELSFKRAYSIADVEQGEEFSIFTFLIKLIP